MGTLQKTALAAALVAINLRRCRRCGCTENSGCAGGCWWIEHDLCSQCRTNKKQPPTNHGAITPTAR